MTSPTQPVPRRRELFPYLPASVVGWFLVCLLTMLALRASDQGHPGRHDTGVFRTIRVDSTGMDLWSVGTLSLMLGFASWPLTWLALRDTRLTLTAPFVWLSTLGFAVLMLSTAEFAGAPIVFVGFLTFLGLAHRFGRREGGSTR